MSVAIAVDGLRVLPTQQKYRRPRRIGGGSRGAGSVTGASFGVILLAVSARQIANGGDTLANIRRE
jgi:hypothetical protein